jgi:hypothetical protein
MLLNLIRKGNDKKSHNMRKYGLKICVMEKMQTWIYGIFMIIGLKK